MPRIGKQTWKFENPPEIQGTGTVAGKLESEGSFGELYDIRHSDDHVGQKTWEQAEQQMLHQAASVALTKAGVTESEVDLIVGGDLNAQLTGLYFGSKSLSPPVLGVFSACATITQALAMSAMAIDGGFADRALVGTCSHNSTAERQFRYPTEYGVQKPPSAQHTVTGAGMAVLGHTGGRVKVTAATIGRVCDFGITSPWEMGAAMAPAAKSTIVAHLEDSGSRLADFDCIVTGDLGRVGLDIVRELLKQDNLDPGAALTDCGAMIYRSDQPEVFSGGSGGACCTLVTYSYLLQQLTEGTWKRILLAATGALLSAVTVQQSETIPCISHAVVLERKD